MSVHTTFVPTRRGVGQKFECDPTEFEEGEEEYGYETKEDCEKSGQISRLLFHDNNKDAITKHMSRVQHERAEHGVWEHMNTGELEVLEHTIANYTTMLQTKTDLEKSIPSFEKQMQTYPKAIAKYNGDLQSMISKRERANALEEDALASLVKATESVEAAEKRYDKAFNEHSEALQSLDASREVHDKGVQKLGRVIKKTKKDQDTAQRQLDDRKSKIEQFPVDLAEQLARAETQLTKYRNKR
jgi:chromosome segregation ATPase